MSAKGSEIVIKPERYKGTGNYNLYEGSEYETQAKAQQFRMSTIHTPKLPAAFSGTTRGSLNTVHGLHDELSHHQGYSA